MKVLHVTESLGGGVAAALEDYITHTADLEHHVIGHRHAGCQIGDRIDDLAPVRPMASGHVRRLAQIAAVVDELQPAIVHAHSSYAGLYVRTARIPRDVAVVYTPHCYGMERTDLPLIVRKGTQLVESLLGGRTDCIAGVSSRETELAGTSLFRPLAVHVPNVARLRGVRQRERNRRRPLQAVGMGRLCAQKDPAFFALAAREAQDFNIEWTWIGGGSEEYADLLRDAGVKVTGWMDRSDAMRLLASADVYVHSAAWEGAPLTILEAAALGIPVIARHIAAVASLGVRTVLQSAEMARAVAGLEDPRAHAEAVRLGDQLTMTNSPERQREALLEAYSLAFERAGRRVAKKPGADPEVIVSGGRRMAASLRFGRSP